MWISNRSIQVCINSRVVAQGMSRVFFEDTVNTASYNLSSFKRPNYIDLTAQSLLCIQCWCTEGEKCVYIFQGMLPCSEP